MMQSAELTSAAVHVGADLGRIETLAGVDPNAPEETSSRLRRSSDPSSTSWPWRAGLFRTRLDLWEVRRASPSDRRAPELEGLPCRWTASLLMGQLTEAFDVCR